MYDLINKIDIINLINNSINDVTEKHLADPKHCKPIEYLKKEYPIIYSREPLKYIKEKLYVYILRLAISELFMIDSFVNNDFVEPSDTIAQNLADKNKEIVDSKNIKYSNRRPIERELTSNDTLKEIFDNLNFNACLRANPNEYPDSYMSYYIDQLSYGYLLHDLDTDFSLNYFTSDLNFLYKKMITSNNYLLSSDKYTSYLTNTLSKKRNLFNHCTALKQTILSKDSKKSKNYLRLLHTVEKKYNAYVDEINELISSSTSIYEFILLKSQFDNFLFNDFFLSLDNELFDYLSQNIDLLYIFKLKETSNNRKYTAYDCYKAQDNVLHINLLKMLMLFNIDMTQLIDEMAFLGAPLFKKETSKAPYNLQFTQDTLNYTNDLLYYIFDILWTFYTESGEMLSKIIHTGKDDDNDFLAYLSDTIKEVCRLLQECDEFNKNFEHIDLTSFSNTINNKNYCLLISYLFTSTIKQKAFYNLYFD